MMNWCSWCRPITRGRREMPDPAICFRQVQWILREPGSGTRSIFEAALPAFGLEARDLAIALELPSNEAVRTTVRGGCRRHRDVAACRRAIIAGRCAQGHPARHSAPTASMCSIIASDMCRGQPPSFAPSSRWPEAQGRSSGDLRRRQCLLTGLNQPPLRASKSSQLSPNSDRPSCK